MARAVQDLESVKPTLGDDIGKGWQLSRATLGLGSHLALSGLWGWTPPPAADGPVSTSLVLPHIHCDRKLSPELLHRGQQSVTGKDLREVNRVG